MPQAPTAVIVLAAGLGTRMKSETPKVLHCIAGRSLLGHVLTCVEEAGASTTCVVVGHGRDHVAAEAHRFIADAVIAVQEQQNGTGHAVQVALEQLSHITTGTVVIVAGDTPLLTADDINRAIDALADAKGVVVTARVEDPFGYGRIVRGTSNIIERIVEHKDASDIERTITEINSGVYAFDVASLRQALSNLTTNNAQNELYLTDVVAIMRSTGAHVVAVEVDALHVEGVNDRKQLAQLGARMRDRIATNAMLAGVTIIDPHTVWIDSTVTIEPDAFLLPNVSLHGATHIAHGATIGPDCTLTDTVVDSEASVVRTTAHGARIGARATVGPYTYLRPGTVLHEDSKAGGFVEIKSSEIGAGAKVPHLSYVGDAVIGKGTNIGAATVFVNYDGVEKHRTVIGDHVRIGSDTMLVAPVTVGSGAYTAAGSVITEDVPAGAMGVARAKQRNIIDWVLRRRPGSESAKAALADSTSSSEPRE